MRSVRYGLGVAVFWAVWIGAAAVSCAAQGPVAGDRPGFGDGASVVAPGRVQVEAGYAYSDLDGFDQHAFGQMLLRFGVARRVELRAGLISYLVQERGCSTGAFCIEESGHETGVEDLSVGVKVNLIQGTGQPVLAAIVDTALPTGNDAFSGDEVTPTLKLALDVGLSDAVTFSGNVGNTFTLGGNLVEAFFTYLALGVGVPGLEGLDAFAGFYSLFPRSADVANSLDGGFVYRLNNDTQLDVNLGFGLTPEAADFFIGAGIARRF